MLAAWIAAGPSFGTAASPGGLGVAPRPVTPVSTSWNATEPLRRGINAWASGRRPEALKWFRLAVGVAPRDPIAWHNLGVALYGASKFDDALDAFIKERFLVPRDPSASFGVGECELAQGKPVEAERDIEVAISLAPNEWQYWQTLAEVFRAQHRDSDAALAASQSTRLRPRRWRVPWSAAVVERAIMTLRFPPTATFRP